MNLHIFDDKLYKVPDYKVKLYVRVKRNTDRCGFKKVFDRASFYKCFDQIKYDSFKMISKWYLSNCVKYVSHVE